MIIFVHHAGFVRPGFARIELAIHGDRTVDAHHLLASAAYRVAATLEGFAAKEALALDVSASKARIGVVEFSYAIDGPMANDVATEIAIDACGENDLLPADVLVELGEIEPNEPDSERTRRADYELEQAKDRRVRGDS